MFKWLETNKKELKSQREIIDFHMKNIYKNIENFNHYTGVFVTVIYENENIVNQIISELIQQGYKATMNKYYNIGYEIGVFLWI